MYPNLYYIFKDLFGVSVPVLKIVNTFGFFVAIAFLVAAWVLVKELRRKQAQGIFTYTETTLIVGKPAEFPELLINFIFGFIIGYKFLGLFLVKGALDNPQDFIVSSQGHIFAGLLVGLILGGLKWWEKNKVKLAKPEERIIRIWPSDRVGDVTIIAAIAGFAGAKIFDNLENWDRFIQDPIGNLFSRSGLTFYGGLICATLALWYYFRKQKISFINICDAAAPSLMLSYGLGRIGCQVSGDGDWGIINSAYLSFPNGKLASATPSQIDTAMGMFGRMYVEAGQPFPPQHATVKAFAGLPDWFFAYSYPHNVNKMGVSTANCNFDDYCNHLPMPVFPTPLYEIIMALLISGILWSIRKKINIPGRLFAIYLMFNGAERFLIEKIRVNTKYSFLGLHPTQAELISFFLVLAGVFLYWYAPKMKISLPGKPITEGAKTS
jgi:phosphatidylglycerol:prolipoprotein diacylglycerol transferase